MNEWTMKELVKALLEEVELRKNHVLASGPVEDEEVERRLSRHHPRTANTLFIRKEDRRHGCAWNLQPRRLQESGRQEGTNDMLRKYSV